MQVFRRLQRLRKTRTVSLLIGLALFGLLVLLLPALLTLLTRWLPAEPISAGIPSSRLIRAADGSVLRLTLARDGQYRLWTPLAQLADVTTEAILLKEDRYFYWHPGVNLLSLARAALATYTAGASVRAAPP